MKNNYSAGFNTRIFNKSITLFSLLFLMSLSLKAQDRGKEEYTRITSPNYLEQLLQKKSTSEYVITSEHTSKMSGIKHTYVRQAINGLEVFGTESSLHTDVTGKTVVAHVNFVKEIGASVKNSSTSITAEQAISRVAQQMNYQLSNLAQIESPNGINQKGLYNGAGISGRDIPVKLMYYYQEEIGTHLVWELSVMEKDSPDWWNFRVDASSGAIIDKDNWTNSCDIMGDHSEEGHKAMAKNKANKLAEAKTALPAYTVAEENTAMVQTYNVFALPKEDPYNGPRTLEVNPANTAVNASPLGWHNDGTTSYTYTKGNNVAAYDDGNNDNNASEADHTPESAAGLIFNYAFNATEPGGNPIYSAAAQSEDAAITNLFYWNNIIHDVMYQYGFNEASGNFQENNFANGGIGSDSVDAQAQDSADLAPTGLNRCNANFGTPADGGNPRMQMYICDNGATPDHNDGDFDNLVIVHEYAHGISNRLVGGPGVDNALQNTEQMGEGWSDFYGYMLTMSATNATSDRAVGNFLFDFGPTGGGIRNAPYSTNLTTNPWTYAGVANTGSISQPHGIGFIWATMLYEMTQALIIRDGFDPNLYTGTGGNNVAIKLVTEGLKLTPVSPGFVDGRDAILAADVALYGGANQCLIWAAFAKRGLGFGASQGSSASRTDGVEAFDTPVAAFAPSRTEICMSEGVVTGLTGGTLIGGVYSGPNVTDGGDGLTFSFDASAASLGMNTITYTDPCTATMAMATITVTDGVPVVSCMNVTLTLDGAGMAIYDPLASIPSTLAVVGGNNGSNSAGTTTMQVSIAETVNISFDWLFDSTDDAGFDDFGYTLNGIFTNLSNGAAYPASGNSSLLLNNDDVFGFTVQTDDNRFGGARSTITNFSPEFRGQFAEANWTEVLTNSDGSANFSGNIFSTTITGDCGNPSAVTASQTVFTCNDIGDNIVTISVDNGIGIGTCMATVTIVGPTSTFASGSWDVAPDAIRKVFFNANYNTSAGDVTACACEVAMGSTVTVDAGGFLDINGNIKVGIGSTLLVQHEGSVRQINDDATVTNDGTITIEKTTPSMAAKSFMISGSPMTGETREGVFGPAYIVRHHVTGNFIPNADVEAVSPGINNWADDNGNNWLTHTGGVNPGEGYMVFPQPNGSGSGTFTQTHTLGTLNNGVIDFNMGYNGTQNGSPNMLANPYASAIDVEVFFDHPSNSNIDVVYFWEHITPLSAVYPGYHVANFNMGDISLYSESLAAGVKAANAPIGTPPPTQFIASGQGFSVKPTAGGIAKFNNAMRVTGPNDSYRTSDPVNRDRLWIHVSNDTYGLGSTALIGFTETTSDGFIISEDVHRLPTPVSLYSELETGEELVVNALDTFEISDAFYLSFTTQVEETQDYRISIQDIDGVNLENASVYIIDSLTGSVINLTEGDYTFQSGEAVYHNRFKVVFEYSALGINNPNLESVSLYPNPTQNTVTIVSPQAIVTSATVYDIRGRKVSEVDFSNQTNYQIDLSTVESALYFIEIATENGTVMKRLMKE
jgi:hypothetical protein